MVDSRGRPTHREKQQEIYVLFRRSFSLFRWGDRLGLLTSTCGEEEGGGREAKERGRAFLCVCLCACLFVSILRVLALYAGQPGGGGGETSRRRSNRQQQIQAHTPSTTKPLHLQCNTSSCHFIINHPIYHIHTHTYTYIHIHTHTGMPLRPNDNKR